MKFHDCEIYKWKQRINILPTIVLFWNSAVYLKHNFIIEFDWLWFHGEFIWTEDGKE